jgi:hypothetical protein
MGSEEVHGAMHKSAQGGENTSAATTEGEANPKLERKKIYCGNKGRNSAFFSC